jgi:hypothetical protein
MKASKQLFLSPMIQAVRSADVYTKLTSFREQKADVQAIDVTEIIGSGKVEWD